jgi:hypothetical protein
LFKILNLGGHVKENYRDFFGINSDESDAGEIRKYWHEVNSLMNERIEKLNTSEWFSKHANISEEDFEKEPHRNKLNVLLDRTSHLTHHGGQLLLLKNK